MQLINRIISVYLISLVIIVITLQAEDVNYKDTRGIINEINSSIDSIIVVREETLKGITRNNIFSISRQYDIEIDTLFPLRSLPDLPYDLTPDIKKRRNASFWLALSSAALWGLTEIYESNPPEGFNDDKLETIRALGDLFKYLAIASGSFMIYSQADLMLEKNKIDSRLRHRSELYYYNDSIKIVNKSVFQRNSDRIEKCRESFRAELDSLLNNAIRNQYIYIDAIRDSSNWLTIPVCNEAVLLSNLSILHTIEKKRIEAMCNQDCSVVIDSIGGVITNGKLDIDTLLIYLSNPIFGWVNYRYISIINNCSDETVFCVKDSTVKAFADTLLNSYTILNRGDKLRVIMHYNDLVKVEAEYYNIDSMNTSKVTGFIYRNQLVDSVVERMSGKYAWVKPFEINLRAKPNTQSEIIRRLEHGNKVKFLKLRYDWAFIEYIEEVVSYYGEKNERRVFNGWVYMPLLSFEEIEKYTWEEKYAIRRNKFLSELFEQNPSWSNEIKMLIRYSQVRIGMTRTQVEASWGDPEDINRSVGSWGVHEQWVYPNGKYLYFEDGILTSWQD